MAADLGTWPPEQATVLVEVLQRAGITPQAKRTREGVTVTVEDAESDQAHATLVANMDTIARAARPSSSAESRRTRGTPQRRPSGSPRQGAGDADTPLITQRLGRFARPLAILLVALLIAAAPIPFGLRILVLVGAVLTIVWVLGREPDGDDEH